MIKAEILEHIENSARVGDVVAGPPWINIPALPNVGDEFHYHALKHGWGVVKKIQHYIDEDFDVSITIEY